MDYRMEYGCNDGDPEQAFLNRICGYENDVPTKIQHRKRINLFFRLMNDLKAKGELTGSDAAVDIGCGTGFYSALISSMGFKKVTGVDIGQQSVDNAKRHFFSSVPGREIDYVQGDAQVFRRDSEFDLVLCTEVIEHTDDPMAVIRNIRDMMKPSGIAIISMPNLVSIPMFELIAGSKLRKKPLDLETQQHLDYPFFKVIEMFKESGYEIIHYRGTNMFVGAFSTKFLYGRSGFAVVNRLDSLISKYLPFCCFSQYFYVVLRRSKA
jgi:2-polyprenyl-3-methyl-5-hydroxy-6-metoxy-1,4-benzoquinol methylase